MLGPLAFLILVALSGCGFVRVLLLEPFDEVELEPQTFDMSASDAATELTRETLAKSQSDLATLQKQGHNEGFRKAVDNFRSLSTKLTATLQNNQSGLLVNLSIPDRLNANDYQSELRTYQTLPDQHIVYLHTALTTTLPKPLFQRSEALEVTLTQDDLKIRVLRYPFDDLTKTFFSHVNGPTENAPDCRQTSCAKADAFLSGLGAKPVETEAEDVEPFNVTIQNFYMRSQQQHSLPESVFYNTYQAAVQCARATVKINGVTSVYTWPRLASVVLNAFIPADTYRYTMMANTLLTGAANTVIGAPVESVEVVSRPIADSNLNVSKMMRVKGFDFSFDGANSASRYEYHHYLVPFFSRFWNTQQTRDSATSYFASSIPKGRLLLLQNSGPRTEFGNHLLPSFTQVEWLASNWQVENPSSELPPDDWAELKPFQIFKRNGTPDTLEKHPDFNPGGALHAQPSLTDGPQSIDKYLLAIPTDFWKTAAFKSEGENYKVKEFFDSLGASCSQAMSTN